MHTPDNPILAAIQRCDFFPKVADDFKSRTPHGGTVTIVCALFITSLMIGEFYYYSQPLVKHKMYVDMTHTEKLRINVNVTFPHLPCGFLSLDTLDASGEHQLNVIKNFDKIRLDQSGTEVHTPPKDINALINELPRTGMGHGSHVKVNADGSIEIEEDQGVVPQTNTESQRKALQEVAEFMSEGCRMTGTLWVTKVAGNFHFSLHGISHHALTTLYTDMYQIDISHHIHELSFGVSAPGTHNPLDGVDRTMEDGAGTFQYYLKIVPTVYEYKGYEMQTNQYSVTEHFKSFRDKHDDHGHSHGVELPAVYFVYEHSPIMVRITKGRPPLFTFLTRLCAIVGGVFTVAGLLDSGIHQFFDAIIKKYGAAGSLGDKPRRRSIVAELAEKVQG